MSRTAAPSRSALTAAYLRRVPPFADHVHRRKLEQDETAPVVLAFERFDGRAPRQTLAAKLGDERTDRFAVLAVLRFVGDLDLDDQIGRHILGTPFKRSVAHRPPKISIMRLAAQDIPMHVELAVRQNLDLALAEAGLDDARLRHRPPALLVSTVREPPVGAVINPVAVVPAELLAGNVLGGDRLALNWRRELSNQNPLRRAPRRRSPGRRETILKPRSPSALPVGARTQPRAFRHHHHSGIGAGEGNRTLV